MKPVCILFFAVFFLQIGATQEHMPSDKEVVRLEQELARRTKIMNSQYVDDPHIRAGIMAASGANFLTETVIFAKAKELGLDATDAEVHTFILPMVAQQGLVDYTCEDVFSDPNIRTWLKGQEMPMEDFKNAGKAIVLWAKIATQGVSVTENEVKQYVKENPNMAIAPARVRIELTQYTAPSGLVSRSVLPSEVLAPSLALSTRALAAKAERPVPEEYEHLQLWLELEKIDIVLRQAIGGQAVGYAFGPLLLSNGAVVEGYVKEFAPQTDFSANLGFWALATIRARLTKANQEELFEKMVEDFLITCPSIAVRGFWGKIWGGLKQCFSPIAAGVGGVIGFFATGSPQGALIGAKCGYQIANAIKGWFSGSQNPPSLPSYQPIPPLYLNRNDFQVPPAYPRPVFVKSGMQYTIPPIPAGYQPQQIIYPQDPRNYWGAPVEPQWAPQVFFPQPVRYF